MRTIEFTLDDSKEVRIDGELVASATGVRPAPAELEDDSIRHDTPLEVVIAATCHEANRQYCRSLGDDSSPPWSLAPGDLKASIIAGVRDIQSGAVTSPEQSHDRWMARELDSGWVYGPRKDRVSRTHPDLVPYEKLAANERRKDRLFFAIATALLAAE